MAVYRAHNDHSQRGAVLVVCLILLLVLTVLSVSTARTTLLQEKMTGAVMDSHLALQAAELGVNSAEAYLETLITFGGFTAAGTGGLYAINTAPGNAFASTTWSNAAKVRTATESPVAGVSSAQYIIENIGLLDSGASAASINVGGYDQAKNVASTVTGFRIVSRGLGRSTDTERVIVSYYGKSL